MAWTVDHPKYGRGLVKQSRNKGFEILVDFQDGRSRWIRRDQVKEHRESSPTHVEKHSVSVLPNESQKARRMIEAFRMGIVPLDCVNEFTFGRQSEIRQLTDWLNNWENNKNALVVVGAYGTGKTHLLNYVYGLALNENVAVARVEMDPFEVPFYKPKRVYGRLIQSLQFHSGTNSQIQCFRDLVTQAVAQGLLSDQPYLKHLIKHFGQSEVESYWEWIEGRFNYPQFESPHVQGYWYDHQVPQLPDFGTAANIYCNLLSSVGWATKQAVGLDGLLLIFDEAEAVSVTNSLDQLLKSFNFLRALIRTANNDPKLTGYPWGSGLVYAKVGQLPFIYRVPTRLKILFAFTPSPLLDDTPELSSSPRLPLDTLADDTLKKVFKQICETYATAYRFDNHDMLIEQVFDKVSKASGRTRMFVKASVEALDLLRHSKWQKQT